MLKKIIRFCLLLIVSCVCMHAGNDEEAFLSANEYYKKQEWKDALAQYQKITAKGPAVWYNMGNCFFYTQQNADALVCWLRAKKRGSYAITVASDNAIEQLVTKLHISQPKNFFETVYTVFAQRSAQDSLLLFQLILFTIIMIGWWYIFKKGRYNLLILFMVMIGDSGALCVVKYIEQTKCLGVVMVADSPLYAGPSAERYHQLAQLSQAQIVTIQINYSHHWCKIVVNGVTGWIQKEYISIV